ncbi:hypothetical protein BDA99DRAFT_579762 [Phascolomyces articulosus]|uniref:F-box domain-containing protein n=1 Tax=Phascolomyces articulosus TaxID=60185 RepID=A0AAD5KC92_9FUNG|nr:hypothetical protein BDA99DRAFT_579762 [Phascolomyces articulosus]
MYVFGQQIQETAHTDQKTKIIGNEKLNITTGIEVEITIRQFLQTVDPFQILPKEIIAHIITLLPQDIRITCAQVSRSWRIQTLGCAEIWSNLKLEQAHDGNNNIRTLLLLSPYYGHHVQSLILDTREHNTWSLCMKKLQLNYFNQIRSLQLIVRYGILSDEDQVLQTTAALREIQGTLTKLQIHIASVQGRHITIAHILTSCSGLTDLYYSTISRLSLQTGYFDEVPNYQHLVNLVLSKSVTSKEKDIQPILEKCQQLRRLVVNGWNESVLDTLARFPTPNLEILGILGYNPGYSAYSVPQLPSSQKKKAIITTPHNNPHNQKNDTEEISSENRVGGSWGLFVGEAAVAVSVSKLWPFLYKNRETLKTIYIHMKPITTDELRSINIKYPDFYLYNITKLVAWVNHENTQNLISQSIQNSSTLTNLTAIKPYNVSQFIDGTLVNLPQLKQLELQHWKNTNPDNTTDLIRLFNRFAQLSSSSSIKPTNKNMYNNKPCYSVLQSLRLRWVDKMFTDDVLASITGIKSLCHIELTSINHITTEGLRKFFTSPLADQLKLVDIAFMDAVTDDVIISIGNMKNVNTIWLQGLDFITDDSICSVVDKLALSNKNGKKWTTLALFKCGSITQGCISYAKTKITRVVHNIEEIQDGRYTPLIEKLTKASYTLI